MFHRASVWLFGEEGDILADSGTQALIFASSVLVTGSMLLSPLIADLATVFGVSETRAGLLIVGFTAAAAVTVPLVGVFADSIGRKRLLVAGQLVFGVAGAGVGVVNWFEAALALRVLQGIAFATAAPIILTLFGDLYSGARETTVQGMRVSVNAAMNTVVPVLAAALFVFSWRYPFAVYLVSIPAALWVWAAVPSIDVTSETTFRTYIREMLGFLSDRAVALLMISFMFRFVLFYGLITYVSVLAVRDVGLTVTAVGILMSARGAAKSLSSTQAGRLSLSIDPAAVAIGSFVLVAGGTILMGAVPTPGVLLVALLIWGVGDGLLSPSQKSLVNRIAPPAYRGGANAAAVTFQNVGKVVGPAGLGALLGLVGPAPAFVLTGIVAGVLGIGSLLGMVALRRSA